MNTREKGDICEDIACYFLKKRGYEIVERNYLKKWGEIDIIASKADLLHFIEVKGIYVAGNIDQIRPEENVNELKIKKLRRIIQTYLNERGDEIKISFQFHVITVKIDSNNNKYYVKMIENIIL